jgi:hypothetical protein
VARISARAFVPATIGVALIASAATARDASAYVVKKTTNGELVHWEEAQVGYSLDRTLLTHVEGSEAATLASMHAWSGTVGAPELVVRAADASAAEKPGFDQKNGIFFEADGWAPAGRALAITVLTYDNSTGRILDSDVIFNGAYRFAVLEAPSSDALLDATNAHPSATDGITHDEVVEERHAIYDLHHVIAHELGHSLGMNDELSRRDALMYRYSAPYDATMREPASDDIAGLAELYSTRIESSGHGCGGATVAPKKPSLSHSQAALFGALALLAFLLFRARTDARARVAFTLAAALATIGFLPSASGTKGGAGTARASELAPGHARARVLGVATTVENGLFRTTYEIATVACHASGCPTSGHGATWGGTIGNLRQEVGGHYAPTQGDEVDVSFDVLADALRMIKSPLGTRTSQTSLENGAVRVLTRAAN